ncbi:hypothetical protein Tco_1553901 [Tanacetum coccineum]
MTTVVNISLDGLLDTYQHVSNIIIHRDSFPDLKTVCAMLTTAEMHLKSRAQATYVDSTSSSPMVLLANYRNNTRRSTPSTEKNFSSNDIRTLQGLLAKLRANDDNTGGQSFGNGNGNLDRIYLLEICNGTLAFNTPVAFHSGPTPSFASYNSPPGFHMPYSTQAMPYQLAQQQSVPS